MPFQTDLEKTVEALQYLTHVVSTGLIEPIDLFAVASVESTLNRLDLGQLEQLQGWLEILRRALADHHDKPGQTPTTSDL